MFTDYAQFKAADRKLREEMKMTSDEFLSHVKNSLTFFHTDGNHNVQIVNDVLDTASAGRLQRNRIVDWIAPIIGHEVIKLDGGKFGFGKKLEDVEYAEIVEKAPEHFVNYPDWYAWKPEPNPEEFDAKATVQKLVKRMLKDAKKLTEHEFKALGTELERFAQHVEVLPLESEQKEESDAQEPLAA
jgi:hypothetical protein